MAVDLHIPASFVDQTLTQFSIHSTKLAAGGLSGARVWKCQSSVLGLLCLRQWSPTHPTPARLQFIHDAIDHASARLSFIPRIHRDRAGNSFWLIKDCLWEVTQWMPGQPSYLLKPSRKKLDSAVHALAELHSIWCSCAPEQGPSPSVTQRIEMLSHWLELQDLVEQVGANVRGPVEAAACMSTVQMLHARGPQLLQQLLRASQVPVTLHPVLRDVWNDHLLFDDENVSGIIDFGATRLDEPAVDLARMLGSLHPFECDVRQTAVEDYNRKRASFTVDPERVDLLDRSGTLLTALQWMKWLILERRKFNADTGKLFERWQTALSRMMGESLIISGD